jgi:hypothetical protein
MPTIEPSKLRVIETDGSVSATYKVENGKVSRTETFATEPFQHNSARPTDRYFDRYAEWRQSKCRPVDRASRQSILADLDQATLELVGEVAETLEMLIVNGDACFQVGTETRMKFIGQLGDIFFTASWLGDAWRINPLMGVPGLDATMLLNEHSVRQLEDIRRRHGAAILTGKPDLEIQSFIQRRGFEIGVEAGLLCNAAKKLCYQLRPQAGERQAQRIAQIIVWAAKLAALADATVTDCLANNIKKLDHRYPLGYQGPGGGDRTGVGA